MLNDIQLKVYDILCHKLKCTSSMGKNITTQLLPLALKG